MNMISGNIETIIQYLLFIGGYFFFCRLTPTLLEYLSKLKTNVSEESQSIKARFDKEYTESVKEPYSAYTERNKHLNPQRTYYKIWTMVSVILVLFNSFILAEFLNNIGNLSKAIMLDPVRLNYSHLIAAVIVMVEIFSGAGYFIFHNNQRNDPDETVWSVLKWLSIMTFLCLLFVETVMWMNLSVNFEMSEKLLLSSNNVFNTAFDYFLAALGIGITFFEFFTGYLTSYYKEYAGESHFVQLGKTITYGIGLILILFIPSILLIILKGIASIITELIKIAAIPGNFIYENIFSKNNKI